MINDAFLTVRYKSGWIHSRYDRRLKKETVTVQFRNLSSRPAVSRHAAKCAITRSEQKLLSPKRS